jgi:16S rRNA (guanine(527)-N(7))-methyltransferase RsmG
MIKNPQVEDAQMQWWLDFAKQEALTNEQLDLFKRYYLLLIAWNKTMNLTTITKERDVIDYHFTDSLQARLLINMNKIMHCCDVGAGAGFPGIPLAIKYPQLKVMLIEVNAKKIQFLDTVITELHLGDRITIFDQDWRTFLRTTQEDIQLFCVRASLQPEELVRMFKPSSPYKNAQLLYWASATWQPEALVAPYIQGDISYTIRAKKRRIILLKNVNSTAHPE